MIEKTYVITMAEAPKSVNAGGGGARAHHMAAHKEKKSWEGKYLMEFMVARVEKGMQFCRIEVTVRWKHKNRRDSTNYFTAIVKPLLDALQKGGYIEDDTDEWVAVMPIRFAYPEEWPYIDPRVKAEMLIKLEASYL